MISENLSAVKAKIDEAARRVKRNPEGVKLVCVTKGRSSDEIAEAVRCGISDIGENKVQEAKGKRPALKDMKISWHMVGHLQTNKAKDAVNIFDLIHSVDSVKLANEIENQASRIDKVQDILVEVNTSGERNKFGADPAQVMTLVKEIVGLKHVNLSGLMTMAPVVKDKEEARPYFRKLREMQTEVNNFLLTAHYSPLVALSMGMSQDYDVAVEEGATIVRVGTAIFGEAK